MKDYNSINRLIKKNAILIVCVLFVLVHIIYLWFDTEIDEFYECSTDGNISDLKAISCDGEMNIAQIFQTKNRKLHSLEFIFANVPEDKSGIIYVSIETNKDVFYHSKIYVSDLVTDCWFRMNVNLALDRNKEYMIRLWSDEGKAIPDIYMVRAANASPEAKNSYIAGIPQQDQIMIRYGYLKSVSLMDKILGSFLWGLLILCIYLLRKLFIKICHSGGANWWSNLSNRIICNQYGVVWEIVLCWGMLNIGLIDHQPSMEYACYIVSIVSCGKVKDKITYLNEKVLKRKIDVICFSILVLWSAFTLVGGRAFLYPLSTKMTIGKVLSYLITVAWMIMPMISCLFYYEKVVSWVLQYPNRMGIWFYITLLFALLIPTAVSLYAFNPGISSPDSLTCFLEAHNIYRIPDWHPPFYILLLKCVIKVWDSTYAVIFVQCFFWCYVLLEMYSFLKNQGLNEWILIISAILFGSNVGVFLLLNTLWKDVPYTIAILWITALLGKLVFELERYMQRWYIYLEFTTALILIALLRQNGIVSYLLVSICVVWVLRSNKKIIISIVCSLVLILCVKGPIYSYIDVQPGPKGGSFVGLGQDILGVYYAGGDISEDTMRIVDGLTNNNISNHSYSPYRATSVLTLNISKVDFIADYIETFIHNPVIMLKEIMLRQDRLWSIVENKEEKSILPIVNGINYHENMDDNQEWTKYYPVHQDNIYTKIVSDIAAYTISCQLLYLFTWRAGIHFLILLITIYYIWNCHIKKFYYLIFAPLAGHILGLLLSTGWDDYRYYWPINILVPSLILFTLIIKRKENRME